MIPFTRRSFHAPPLYSSTFLGSARPLALSPMLPDLLAPLPTSMLSGLHASLPALLLAAPTKQGRRRGCGNQREVSEALKFPHQGLSHSGSTSTCKSRAMPRGSKTRNAEAGPTCQVACGMHQAPTPKPCMAWSKQTWPHITVQAKLHLAQVEQNLPKATEADQHVDHKV